MVSWSPASKSLVETQIHLRPDHNFCEYWRLEDGCGGKVPCMVRWSYQNPEGNLPRFTLLGALYSPNSIKL